MKPLARAALAAAGLAALLAIAPATAQANKASRHSHTARTTYKVEVKAGKPKIPEVPKSLSAARRKAPQVAGCLPPIVALTRVELCLVFPVTVTVIELQGGAPVGDEVYHFGVQTEVSLHATSTKLDLDVTAVGLTTSGDEPELVPSITITSQCDQPCQTTTPQLLALGTPQIATGSASNEVTTRPNQVVWPEPAISLYADFGGGKSSTVSWPVVPVIRCDHLYPQEWQRAGCVFPAFIPTVDMSSLPAIAKNIRKVQGRGRHVGEPGGSHPLHRASGSQQVKNNRNQACPKRMKRPPGYQCDEYPFASAWEGGKKLPPIDRIADWVPKAENQRQGVTLSLFYSQNRILRGAPGDAFDVNA
jgi:Deoxyribonuclease NucA/NucB